MAEKLSVVVVDSDESVRAALKGQLAQMNNVKLAGELKNIDRGLVEVQKTRPDILIIELPVDYSQTLKWTEKVKLQFPEMNIFVSSKLTTSELIMCAMRAGAQEFLVQPINPDELRKAINKILLAREQAQAQAPRSGRIISVFSKKGGLGVTTLAANLGVALSQAGKGKAALFDLDLQLGDITSFLNLSPEYNILDVLDEHGEVDGVKLQSCMTRHESGVFVLSEPNDPAESENVSSSHINQILRHLRNMFSYVVVDTPHEFDSRSLEAFELSDHILVVVVPNISSLRAAKKALGVFKDLGYVKNKVKVVVNRAGKKDQVKTSEIEKVLRYPVSWVVPNNYPVVIEAINSGVPVVIHKGKSNVAKSIRDLANDIPRWNRMVYAETKISHKERAFK